MRKSSGRHVLWITPIAIAGLIATGYAAKQLSIGVQPDGRIIVPTGRALTPAGDHIEVADRPLGMKLSPDGAAMAVVTGSNFNPRALHIIDVASHHLRQTIPIGNSFVGVDFSPSGDRIWVGGGAGNDVRVFKRQADGSFAADGTIAFANAAPSGLSLNRAGTRAYVALNMTNELGVIDTTTRAIVRRVPVGTYPYTAVLSADDAKVYVSNWGGRIPGPNDVTDGMFPVAVDPRTGIPISGTVSVVDTLTNTVAKTIVVGLHPTGMALSPDGSRLFVTNANSDTVSVIDVATDTVARTLHVGPTERGRAPLLGSSPNAVTVSNDGQMLFVANAAENAVAVLDLTKPDDQVFAGDIPTGWYPTAVALDRTGQQLFVASGYGFGSIAPASDVGRSYQDRAGACRW